MPESNKYLIYQNGLSRYGVLNDEDSDDDDRFYSKKKPIKKSPTSSSGNSPAKVKIVCKSLFWVKC